MALVPTWRCGASVPDGGAHARTRCAGGHDVHFGATALVSAFSSRSSVGDEDLDQGASGTLASATTSNRLGCVRRGPVAIAAVARRRLVNASGTGPDASTRMGPSATCTTSGQVARGRPRRWHAREASHHATALAPRLQACRGACSRSGPALDHGAASSTLTTARCARHGSAPRRASPRRVARGSEAKGADGAAAPSRASLIECRGRLGTIGDPVAGETATRSVSEAPVHRCRSTSSVAAHPAGRGRSRRRMAALCRATRQRGLMGNSGPHRLLGIASRTRPWRAPQEG